MKARILDPQVKVYTSMDANTISIASLQEGSEVEIGPTKRKAGRLWVPVILSTGQKGYIPGDAHRFVIREGSLMQDNVDLHVEPSAESAVKLQMKRNTKLAILQVIKAGGSDWVKIRDASNNEGYISGNTQVRLVAQRTKASGRRNIITGVMWLIAGLIFLYSESRTPSTGGFDIFWLIALGFGAIILISGVVQYIKAPS